MAPRLATLCPIPLCPHRRDPDEVPDAHGQVRLPSVAELHAFLCQPRSTHTTLDTRHAWMPNDHPNQSWGPTEPSQLAPELNHLPPDAAISPLVLSSLVLLGSLLQQSTSWNRADHIMTSRTSTDDERLQPRSICGACCTACSGQFGHSAFAILTIVPSICSSAESDEHVPDLLFFEVL